MVGGFNHNFYYKEQTFHVQTEDSGPKKATITTLLYSGGTVLARTTTSYRELLDRKDLLHVVETRMKDQHKQMMRDLKSGCYDERIESPALPLTTPTKAVTGQGDKKKIDLDAVIVAYLSAGR